MSHFSHTKTKFNYFDKIVLIFDKKVLDSALHFC